MGNTFRVAAMSILIATAAASVQAASVTNGGFEDPSTNTNVFSVPANGLLTGWTVSSGNIEII